MQDKGISRNVGKSSSRKPGEGPALGHVSRMATGSASSAEASPKGERRRRKVMSDEEKAHRERRQKESNAVILRWTILFGLGAAAVLALFVMFWLMPMLERRNAVTNNTSRTVYETIEIPKENVPGEVESIRIVTDALASKTPEDVEKWIRPDTSTSGEVLDFLKKMAADDGEIVRKQWLPRLDTTRPDISGVVVFYSKEGKQSNRLALVVPDEDGRWKVDFPALARASVPEWDKFLPDDGAASALVRVYVARDQYYNGPFTEQEGWRCFGVASPDVPELLYGYCQVGSAQERALLTMLSGRDKSRAVLGLDKVEGAASRQFRIKRVMAEDWAVREKPVDEN